jgi:hypothetical protein
MTASDTDWRRQERPDPVLEQPNSETGRTRPTITASNERLMGHSLSTLQLVLNAPTPQRQRAHQLGPKAGIGTYDRTIQDEGPPENEKRHGGNSGHLALCRGSGD